MSSGARSSMCRGPGAEASMRHLTPPARSRGARSGLWHWSRAVLWTRAVGQEVVSGGPSQGGGRGGGALMLVDGVRLLPQEKSRVVGGGGSVLQSETGMLILAVLSENSLEFGEFRFALKFEVSII